MAADSWAVTSFSATPSWLSLRLGWAWPGPPGRGSQLQAGFPLGRSPSGPRLEDCCWPLCGACSVSSNEVGELEGESYYAAHLWPDLRHVVNISAKAKHVAKPSISVDKQENGLSDKPAYFQELACKEGAVPAFWNLKNAVKKFRFELEKKNPFYYFF